MQECCRLRTMYFWRYMWTEVIIKSSVRNNEESSLFFLTMNWELIVKNFFAWHAKWNFHCDLGHKVVCTLWTEQSKTTRQHFCLADAEVKQNSTLFYILKMCVTLLRQIVLCLQLPFPVADPGDHGPGAPLIRPAWRLFETDFLTSMGLYISLFNWLIFLMKCTLHIATKLNSRDIKKCNYYCFWVSSYDLFTSAHKAVFPALMATGVHRLRNTWSSVICQSFLNQSLDPSPPNPKFLDPHLLSYSDISHLALESVWCCTSHLLPLEYWPTLVFYLFIYLFI